MSNMLMIKKVAKSCNMCEKHLNGNCSKVNSNFTTDKLESLASACHNFNPSDMCKHQIVR